MFLLKKLFNFRGKSSPEEGEKPFMAHLEDLRDMIVRVVLTLILSTVLCYVFRGELMDLLRRPIETVWVKSQEAKLPERTILPVASSIAYSASFSHSALT